MVDKAKRTFLYTENGNDSITQWINQTCLFHVTQSARDWAEVCELV